MPTPLLTTKLILPPLRPSLKPRPHLIKRLHDGLQSEHNLTLIATPAGFGKVFKTQEQQYPRATHPTYDRTATKL